MRSIVHAGDRPIGNEAVGIGASGRCKGALAVLVTLAAMVSGCVVAPPPRPRPPPPPPAVAAPSPQVFFYPQRGQSTEQQDRDRYECYVWAKQQTGFDPSNPSVAPQRRVQVVPARPIGQDTAVGATAGAVLGAMVSRPRDALGGAVIGAVVGGTAGAVSDSSRQAQAERIQSGYDQQSAAEAARQDRQVVQYRRAMSACLEGRGYTVQ